MTLYLLCNSISKGNVNRAINQFNLRHAVLGYFNDGKGGEKMGAVVENVRKNVDRKINIKEDKKYEVEIESDREYHFCIGQLLNYFYSLNRSASKNYSFINTIINARNVKVVRDKLRALFIKYDYAIQSSFRFNNMYYMVLSYEPEGEIDKDLIIAGFLCPNLIYKKSEDNNKKHNDTNKGEN